MQARLTIHRLPRLPTLLHDQRSTHICSRPSSRAAHVDLNFLVNRFNSFPGSLRRVASKSKTTSACVWEVQRGRGLVWNTEVGNAKALTPSTQVLEQTAWGLDSRFLSAESYLGWIYIYVVKLLTGPRLAILIVTNWATLIVTNWATSISHYKNRGFRWFFGCSVIISCFFFVFSYFSKRGAKIVFFNFQCFKLFFWKFSFFG